MQFRNYIDFRWMIYRLYSHSKFLYLPRIYPRSTLARTWRPRGADRCRCFSRCSCRCWCRYMAIIHPLKPRMGAGLVLTVIAGIWAASIAIAFPMLLYAETHTFNDTYTVCYLKWPDGDAGSPTDFASVSSIGVFFYSFRNLNCYVVLPLGAALRNAVVRPSLRPVPGGHINFKCGRNIPPSLM